MTTEFTPKKPLYAVLIERPPGDDLQWEIDFCKRRPEAKFFRTKEYKDDERNYLMCAWSECEWSLDQYMETLTDELPECY